MSTLADGAASVEDVRYVGLATRAISFTLDAVLIDVAATIVGLGAALMLSLLHLPKDVRPVLLAVGAAAYVLWLLGYFVFFWTTSGQTPGGRALQIRVVSASGKPLGPRRALVRCVGVFLAALPLFVGFLPVLLTRRRRAFQDFLARTLVVEAPGLSVAQAARASRRAAYHVMRQPSS